MKSIQLTRPDDWHLHVRDGDVLKSVVPHTAHEFARAIVMPNLKPPVTNIQKAQAYYERIRAAVPEGESFEPLMTLYLTDHTTPQDIADAAGSGIVKAAKLYPSGATTNSDSGVTHWKNVEQTLGAMQAHDMVLCIHGEVTHQDVDVFDRERVFIEQVLTPIVAQFPELKIVLEHITTCEAVEFVNKTHAHVAATITAHHLLMNRNAIFQGGIQPHHYCLPILKREKHRKALVQAATSGSPKFFLGTDSAPHPRGAKESSCGCAGIYTAHAAMPLYAEVFDAKNALNQLESFASFHGPDFYGLPRNEEQIILVKESWEVPLEYELGDQTVIPLRAGQQIHWQVLRH